MSVRGTLILLAGAMLCASSTLALAQRGAKAAKPEAHHAALELTRSMAVDVMYWPTPDPAVATGTRDQIMHSYREVREHLKLLIEKRLKGPG